MCNLYSICFISVLTRDSDPYDLIFRYVIFFPNWPVYKTGAGSDTGPRVKGEVGVLVGVIRIKENFVGKIYAKKKINKIK